MSRTMIGFRVLLATFIMVGIKMGGRFARRLVVYIFVMDMVLLCISSKNKVGSSIPPIRHEADDRLVRSMSPRMFANTFEAVTTRIE